MLTPLDIHNKVFKKSFRGYNEKEIDDFLDQVVKNYEKLYLDNIELKETLDRVSSKMEHYELMEKTLNNTLVIAQETAEEAKLQAKKETELVLKEAEIRAQKLLAEASAKALRMSSENEELKK